MALPSAFHEALSGGLATLGLEVGEPARAGLTRYAEELLRWNARVNLTAVTDPAAVAELHLVDALALLRTLGPARTLLDVGSGAGIPGVVLALARPELEVTCCDSVQKKVAFVKAVSALLGVTVKARAVRAEGQPEREGLPLAEAVVSRAFAEPARWLPLGVRYLAERGRLFAMLGRETDEAELRRLGAEHGLVLEELDRFVLPRSGAQRAVARFARG
jgi:16S rRNA (guanine527-N7)-methyltransferase